MRVFCILMGLLVSSGGLLAMLANPNQWLPNLTWIAGMGLFTVGAFSLKRKSRRIFAGKRRVFHGN